MESKSRSMKTGTCIDEYCLKNRILATKRGSAAKAEEAQDMPGTCRREIVRTTRYLESTMNSYLVWAAVGGAAAFGIVRALIWYFDVAVCIECYKRVRKRESVSAGYRNPEMRLCKECHGQD